MNWIRIVWRALAARPVLISSTALGVVLYLLLPPAIRPLTRAILGWNGGVLLFVLASVVTFVRANPEHMSAYAAAQEEGEWTIFGLTIAGVTFSFAAILGEFSAIGQHAKGLSALRLILVITTLLASWLMTHVTFAWRYAHEYYAMPPGHRSVDAGLEFPSEPRPDYWDFLYFSLVLGMTFQVSDVQITSRKMRRLAMIHGFLSFLFNTVILALSVNLAAGLL
ncbi:MAG: DUF1345 domain-containing protein [Acetobacteraceae bacterium]